MARESNVQKEHIANSDRPVSYYDLDVIVSVGYRVKSQPGVEFRRRATQVLRRHIVEGRTESDRRLMQFGQVARVMKRLEDNIEAYMSSSLRQDGNCKKVTIMVT